MKLKNIEARLGRLERQSYEHKHYCVWLYQGMTQEQALYHRYPDGVPDGARVVYVSWKGDRQPGA